MGKYIIEIPDDKIGDFKGSTHLLMPYSMAGHKGHHDTGLPITPYTEPDLERVREDAFKNGYDAACKDIDIKSKTNAAHRKGLADAWEAARKIIHIPEGDLLNIFTECYSAVCTALQVILKYDASEAIEKLKAYEQEQEEIKVGDEVAFHNDDRPDTVVVVTYIGEDGFIDGMDGRGTQYAHKNPKRWKKTGRTFPEIADVLEKMRGKQDGERREE